MVKVTVNLSDESVKDVKWLASVSKTSNTQVLTDAIEVFKLLWENKIKGGKNILENDESTKELILSSGK